MKRLITSFCVLAVFLITVLLLSATFRKTPAFNATLREDNVFGVSQLRYSAPMYDMPAYLFQIGVSYLRADLLVGTEAEDDIEVASVENAFARAEQAEAYFKRSLAQAPANAHVWTALAWARTFEGDTDGARDALRKSWALAPNHRQLAGDRLDLAEVLYAWDTPELTITPENNEARSLERDRALIEAVGRIQP